MLDDGETVWNHEHNWHEDTTWTKDDHKTMAGWVQQFAGTERKEGVDAKFRAFAQQVCGCTTALVPRSRF